MARRVRTWLKKNERTQAWLAAQLGISRPYVSAILAGDRGLSLTLAAQLETLTGIPVHDFAQAS